MSITTATKKLDAVTLLDSKWRLRDNLLKGYFSNSIDALSFYEFSARIAQLPAIGRPYKKVLNLYYRYVHTNSLVFPLKDIEEIIKSAAHIYVDPCTCRLAAGEKACNAPLFVCMRINRAAEIRKIQEDSEGLSKDDALAVMRNARKYNLVFSLESCIQPYQYQICACCSDCCVAMRMRYRYGLDAYQSGPYLPEFGPKDCKQCSACIDKCPVHALSVVGGKPVVDLKTCLGCGICAEICPNDSIEMIIHQDRMRKDEEPGAIRLFISVLFIYLMMLPVFAAHRLITGSRMNRLKTAAPIQSDLYHEGMQKRKMVEAQHENTDHH
jgi:Pyruvate/2-oxoacid:ferredoxin oxidoreductase delta subunit